MHDINSVKLLLPKFLCSIYAQRGESQANYNTICDKTGEMPSSVTFIREITSIPLAMRETDSEKRLTDSCQSS
jgi:hypothetical protein